MRALRRSAQDAIDLPKGLPSGWVKSPVDPNHLLRVFRTLRLKPGFVLRAYQFQAGGNGNGFVYAMPAEAPFPEPEQCPREETRFLSPPVPPGALADLMEAIDSDGSAWSYMEASLFAREIAEFGATWHGCDWVTHRILGTNPFEDGDVADAMNMDPEGWEWSEPMPEDWRPTVTAGAHAITVTFYTHTALQSQRIVRHLDRYDPGSYVAQRSSSILAHGPPGFVF